MSSISFPEYMETVTETPEVSRPLSKRFFEQMDDTADLSDGAQSFSDVYVEWLEDEAEAYTFAWVDLPDDVTEADRVVDPMQQDPAVLLDDDGYERLKEELGDEVYERTVGHEENVRPSPESALYLEEMDGRYESREELLANHIEVFPLAEML